MGLAHSPRVVTEGLIFYVDAVNKRSYNGVGIGTTTFYNLITNEFNNGEIVGIPTYNNLGYFEFDGSNDIIYTEKQYTSPQVFTLSVWAKTNTGGTKIIGYEANRTGTSSFNYDRQIMLTSSGVVGFGVYDGAVKIATSSSGYNDNQWHNFVGTYGPTTGIVSTLTLYIDGVVSASQTAFFSENYSGYWRIGGYRAFNWLGGVGNGYFNGDISNVSIYNRILTASEVKQNFNALRGRFGI